LDLYDIWIVHNGNKFDLPFLRTRLLKHGLPPLPAADPWFAVGRLHDAAQDHAEVGAEVGGFQVHHAAADQIHRWLAPRRYVVAARAGDFAACSRLVASAVSPNGSCLRASWCLVYSSQKLSNQRFGGGGPQMEFFPQNALEDYPGGH